VNLVATYIALVDLHLPPRLALFLTLAFIVFLFRRDIRERPNVSGALWLPLIWLVFTCSRSFAEWLRIFGLPVSGGVSNDEGSPVDACFFYAMATAGFCILINRQVSLSEVLQRNGWLVAFFAYCLISIVWSDHPFITFKRATKIFGHPIMALIVLTEPDFEEALRWLMKRCAYVVVPISILWIRYYPQLGLSYDDWSGMQVIQGIAAGKNSLGADCVVLGFFFFWHLLQTWRTERNTQRRNELWLIAGFLIGILYLLRLSHSATSTICLFVAILVVVFVGIRATIKNFVGTYMLAALVLLVAAELAFGISGRLSESLGRGSEMSGRTDLWAHCLELQSNPILGAGFESFWVAENRARIAAFYHNWKPGGAHNSYLDTYLDLGLIGLSILIGLIIATFWKIRLELFRDFEWGRYRLGLLSAVVLRAWTETTFTTGGDAALWFGFYIIAIDYPLTHLMTVQPSVEVARSEETEEFAYAEGEP
jgi:exopolysaccharide production protein ExoQ